MVERRRRRRRKDETLTAEGLKGLKRAELVVLTDVVGP